MERQQEMDGIPEKAGREHFIIQFISAQDIPHIENRVKSDPYIKAYLATRVEIDSETGAFEFQRIGVLAQTPRKADCTAAVWNCYKDLGAVPPANAMLVVEIYHHYKDAHKTDYLLGKVDIPVSSFVKEEPMRILLANYKVRYFH